MLCLYILYSTYSTEVHFFLKPESRANCEGPTEGLHNCAMIFVRWLSKQVQQDSSMKELWFYLFGYMGLSCVKMGYL